MRFAASPIAFTALMLAACQQGVAANQSAPAAASTTADAGTTQDVTLTAADGTQVFGTYYRAAKPKALILLFHQAGSSRHEYDSIAPKLAAEGYDALAIDQRSGGTLYGPNATVDHLGRSADYQAAEADLQAALDWAGKQGRPVILWGSSYSAALVFRVAAANPGKVAAVLAFSPGEYLWSPNLVHEAAAKLTVPVFVTSAKDADEIGAARSILAAVSGQTKVQFVPATAGIHGASSLRSDRNAAGAADYWTAVDAFLHRVAP